MGFPTVADPNARQRVLSYIRANGSITNRECRRLLGIRYDEAIALFNAMVSSGELVRIGKTASTRYVLPSQA